MLNSNLGQRMVGLISLLVGTGFTAWSWYTAVGEGFYYHKAAMIFPVFAVLGAAAMFFPLDAQGLQGELSIARPARFLQYPTSWKILTAVAIIAGLANWFALSQVVAKQPG